MDKHFQEFGRPLVLMALLDGTCAVVDMLLRGDFHEPVIYSDIYFHLCSKKMKQEFCKNKIVQEKFLQAATKGSLQIGEIAEKVASGKHVLISCFTYGLCYLQNQWRI